MDSRVWLSGGRQSAAAVTHASGQYTAQIQGVACLLNLELRRDGHLSGTLVQGGETLWLVGGIAGPSSTGSGSGGYGFLLEPEGRSIIALFLVRLEGTRLSLELDVPDFSERLTLSHTEHIRFERTQVGSSGALEETVLFGTQKENL